MATPDGNEWWEQSGPTVSWRTMIEYLQFIRENSNWTTLIGLSYIERINRSHELLMEGSAHDRFNEEQDEDISATLFVIDRTGIQVTTEEQEQEDAIQMVATKRKQVRELLDFLEEQASKSELKEEEYRGYAGLLMEVFKGLGEDGVSGSSIALPMRGTAAGGPGRRGVGTSGGSNWVVR